MKALDVVHLMEKPHGSTWMHSNAQNFYLPKNTHSRYFPCLYKLAFSKTFDIFFYIYIFHSYRKLVWYIVLQSTENESTGI